MSDLIRLNASELVELLAKGEISSVELTQAHLDQIAKVGDAVHSFLHISGESALATAREDRKSVV